MKQRWPVVRNWPVGTKMTIKFPYMSLCKASVWPLEKEPVINTLWAAQLGVSNKHLTGCNKRFRGCTFWTL